MKILLFALLMLLSVKKLREKKRSSLLCGNNCPDQQQYCQSLSYYATLPHWTTGYSSITLIFLPGEHIFKGGIYILGVKPNSSQHRCRKGGAEGAKAPQL